MGLLRTSPEAKEAKRNAKLARLANDDLFLMAEASLMEAAERLSRVRRAADDGDKAALLTWISDNIGVTQACVEEMASRI